jgi:signal transduction histidine kinase
MGWGPDKRKFWQDRQALLVATGYVCIALLYIWTSDWAVETLFRHDSRRIQLIQSFKGTAFVLTTGIVLFAAVAWSNDRMAAARRDKQLVEDMLAVSQRLEGLGALAGTLAHDFNNLLTVIRCETEIMQLENFSTSEIPQHIHNINLATERADHMVRELMFFMRNAPSSQMTGDLAQAIRDSSSFLQQALGRGVELVVRTPTPTPLITYDRSQVERALLNLVINARDAMEGRPSPRIVVETSVQDLRRYRSIFQPDPVTGTFVVVNITDNGCGIPRENFARIFSPFFSTKPSGKGTGLGLTSVLRVMQAHQGWAEVRSEKDQGTTFSLFFPTARG